MDIDFEAHYKVDGSGEIAYYLRGYEQTWEPFTELREDENGDVYDHVTDIGEWIDNTDNVIAVMVGDDREHIIDVDDLIKIEEDDFCRDCGQVGCGHNVYV